MIDKKTKFQNSKHEWMNLDEVLHKIIAFIDEMPEFEYKLSIGTDSMTYKASHFVLAIVLHRVGNGGIYFYKRFDHPGIQDLRTKLYKETQFSIETADLLLSSLLDIDENILDKLNFSIHLDIGTNGPTKDLIKELEGWVMAVGYDYEIKPNSYAASFVADRYSK